MSVELALVISFVSAAFSIFFSVKNSKRTDTKDLEEKVKHDTKVDMKLDEINRNVVDVKLDMGTLRKDFVSLTERVAKVEASTKQAHKRLDSITGKEISNYDNE